LRSKSATGAPGPPEGRAASGGGGPENIEFLYDNISKLIQKTYMASNSSIQALSPLIKCLNQQFKLNTIYEETEYNSPIQTMKIYLKPSDPIDIPYQNKSHKHINATYENPWK
jgi:hypothetical protein